MQDKNQTDVRKILLAIAKHLNVNKIRGLAAKLDINEGTMYAWINRGKIGNTGSILGKVPYLSLEWLETGEGPMMIIDETNIHQVPETTTGDLLRNNDVLIKPKVAAKIEPGPARQNKKETKQDAREDLIQMPDDTDQENISMSDMLFMTSKVLESDTVYKSALASNVRAFYQAVIKEREMQNLGEKLEAMEQKNNEMAERMERMEEMLISLGADRQKREKKAS